MPLAGAVPSSGGKRAEFEVDGAFKSLNEYQAMHFRARAEYKRYADAMVAWSAKAARVPRFEAPVRVHVTWCEKDRRRDLDNVRFGMKFVLDGLVKAGVLPNDGQRNVVALGDAFEVDRKRPRAVVTIEEA